MFETVLFVQSLTHASAAISYTAVLPRGTSTMKKGLDSQGLFFAWRKVGVTATKRALGELKPDEAQGRSAGRIVGANRRARGEDRLRRRSVSRVKSGTVQNGISLTVPIIEA